MKTLLHTTLLATAGLIMAFGTQAQANNTQNLEVLRDIAPEYPASAMRREIGGEVVVRFDVDSKGRARNIEIVNSNHEGMFEGAVKTALRRSAFDNHGNTPVENVERVYRFDATRLQGENQVSMYNAFHQ